MFQSSIKRVPKIASIYMLDDASSNDANDKTVVFKTDGGDEIKLKIGMFGDGFLRAMQSAQTRHIASLKTHKVTGSSK